MLSSLESLTGRRREILILACIFTIGLLLRAGVMGTYLVGDEFDYIERGYRAFSLITSLDFTPSKWAPPYHPALTVTVPIGMFMSLFKGILPEYVAARIPQVILGALTPLLLYLFCKMFVSKRVALLAALLIAFEPIHIGLSGIAHIDVTLTFFFLLTTYSFVRGVSDFKWALISGASFGLALLTKQPAPVLLITTYVTFILLYLVVYKGRRSSLFDKEFERIPRALYYWPIIGVALFFLLWPYFWNPGNVYGYVARATEDVTGGHLNFFLGSVTQTPPPYFYLVLLPVHLSPIVFIGILLAIADFRHNINPRNFAHFLLLSSIVIPFIAFSLTTKMGFRYLGVIFPFLAAISAMGWKSFGGWMSARVALIPKSSVYAIFLPLLALLLFQYFSAYPYMGAYEYSSPIVGGGEVAKNLTLLGWGREIGIAADRINDLPGEPTVAVFASGYQDFFDYYYDHDWIAVDPNNLEYTVDEICGEVDYIVFPINQVQRYCQQGQSGYDLWHHFVDNQQPVLSVEIGGTTFAWVFEC